MSKRASLNMATFSSLNQINNKQFLVFARLALNGSVYWLKYVLVWIWYWKKLQLKTRSISKTIYFTIQWKTLLPISITYIFNECRWKGKVFNCSKHFSPVFTRDGLCFAFNSLNSRDLYTDE